MRCEENLPIFQAPIVIKQRTAKTDAGGGTLTAGPGLGKQAVMEIIFKKLESLACIDGSEPRQNNHTYFFNKIF